MTRKSVFLISLTTLLLLLFTGCAPQDPDAAAKPPTAAEFIVQTVWFVLAGFFVYWLMVIQPKKVEAQEQQKLVDGLKKNDQVLVNGIYGKIVAVKEDAISVDIANGVKIKVRPEVVSVIEQKSEKSSSESGKK